ncbi:MAG: glutamine--fructose-6-phosphate transaminase (isomerizing), partial [Candidatus Nanohaloarchaea archaeon]|nr:glutamine--fructose-6-phosphate transaminase (isomerizing) [Candidatus Nanohaloarchaea archaeon]
IIGYHGDREAAQIVHEGLKRLEYRGYDSAGVATLSPNPGLQLTKGEGEIAEIHEEKDFHELDGSIGIGHTRWATHGEVNEDNAHPHTDCDERLALVHNGIIENYEELKQDLGSHRFDSETDSEVVAHYFEERIKEGSSFEEAIQDFFERAEGTFAIVILDRETGNLYALKRKSPLALGIGDGEHFLGSDLYAFSPYTDEALFFEDDEYAIIDRDGAQVYTAEGETVTREPETFDWEEREKTKDDHDHYMIKEIHEQPDAVGRLMQSLRTSQQDELERFVELIEEHERVIFTAAGTSYHASLLGVYFMQRCGVEAQALIASEFKNYERVDDDTLVIAVSQSGETMDVLEAIDYSREEGGRIASVVNVPHSSIQRESEVSLEVHAGQEVAVASTKAFTNQVVTLLEVARRLGADVELEDIASELDRVIDANEERVKDLAPELADADDVYVVGRGPTYPISREIALKLKEIPYIHAEGMMGGELKHGTLALIEEGTPVLSLIPDEDDEILSNVKEVESRGARSIRISPHYGGFEMPDAGPRFALYATTIGFLLSYYIAKEKDLPIDKPRNLAKSVMVK